MTSITAYGWNTVILVDLLQKETIRLLDEKLVVTPRANRAYEWQLKQQGDTVRVQTFPNVTYSSGTTAWADITESSFTVTSETLTADKLAQLKIPVADITEIVSNLDLMSKLADRIAFAMAKVYEQFVISLVVAWAWTKLYSGWAVTISKSNIYQYVEEMRVALSDNNAFDQAALFVTPNVASLIRQSALFDWFREGLDTRKNGLVGRMSGFEIYESTLIPADKMIAFDRNSVNFVEQMGKTDIRQSPDGFRSNVLSELIYGWKIFTENAKRAVTLLYA